MEKGTGKTGLEVPSRMSTSPSGEQGRNRHAAGIGHCQGASRAQEYQVTGERWTSRARVAQGRGARLTGGCR